MASRPRDLPLFFTLILAGGILIDKGARAFASSASSAGAGGASSSTGAAPVAPDGHWPAMVDPLPGATGSRADQGFDATLAGNAPAPWDGTVVYSSASDPGWQGGGYVAVQSKSRPSLVYYIAEGIRPLVQIGEKVTAGQEIAAPASNPYNGVMGNVEAGLANPASPGQPLAQVLADPRSMVMSFISKVESLGGPSPSNLSSAGHA